jgi:hypothetical protein
MQRGARQVDVMPVFCIKLRPDALVNEQKMSSGLVGDAQAAAQVVVQAAQMAQTYSDAISWSMFLARWIWVWLPVVVCISNCIFRCTVWYLVNRCGYPNCGRFYNVVAIFILGAGVVLVTLVITGLTVLMSSGGSS